MDFEFGTFGQSTDEHHWIPTACDQPLDTSDSLLRHLVSRGHISFNKIHTGRYL